MSGPIQESSRFIQFTIKSTQYGFTTHTVKILILQTGLDLADPLPPKGVARFGGLVSACTSSCSLSPGFQGKHTSRVLLTESSD